MDSPDNDEKKLAPNMPEQLDEHATGKVLVYSDAVNAGMIIAGRKLYLFSRKEWLSKTRPAEDVAVFFRPDKKWARSIVTEE